VIPSLSAQCTALVLNQNELGIKNLAATSVPPRGINWERTDFTNLWIGRSRRRCQPSLTWILGQIGMTISKKIAATSDSFWQVGPRKVGRAELLSSLSGLCFQRHGSEGSLALASDDQPFLAAADPRL
jgi:hypothetical protein